MATLGEMLKSLRKRQKVRQKMLAEKLEVRQQAVSDWENGRASPTLETFMRLADFFGVTLDCLAGRNTANGADYYLYADEAHLIDSYRSMDVVNKGFLMKLVECLSVTSMSQINGNLNIQNQTKNSIIAAGNVNMQNTTNS